jgi:DNA repair protein RadC
MSAVATIPSINEDMFGYKVEHFGVMLDDDEILERARAILKSRMRTCKTVIDSPAVVREYLQHELCESEHEMFGVLWLNARNGIIRDERMFRGTLTQTSVYPREVVKGAMAANAAACILYHNHPSGAPEPSTADEVLTRTLKEALGMVDVRVLDHIIVAGMSSPTSFAERGLI